MFALLGLSNAAVSEKSVASWPNYSAVTAGVNYANAKAYASATAGEESLYRCVREGQSAVMAQKVTGTAIATSATINAFYGSIVAHQGATFVDFGCCLGVTGSPGLAVAVSNTSGCDPLWPSGGTSMAERVVWIGTANYGYDGSVAPAAAAASKIVFNTDFILHSQWQNSWDGTATRVAANYCSKQILASTVVTDTFDFKSMAGLSGLTKCTHLITTTAAKGAPSIELTQADWTKFLLQWTEWDAGAIAVGTYLPATTATPSFLGTYTAGTWPNPIASSTAGFAGMKGPIASAVSDTDPAALTSTAGLSVQSTFGTFSYYDNTAGPFALTKVYTVDSMSVINGIAVCKTAFATYETSKTAYNALATTYNDALAAEKTRAADFFKAMFEAPVTIPSRPCPDSVPAAYAGLSPQWAPATAWSAWTATDKANMWAMPSSGGSLAGVAATISNGFLQASMDTAVVSAAPSNVGHIFGRFGQGSKTILASGTLPFQWKDNTASAHGMLFSCLGTAPTDNASLTGTQSVTVKATVLAFEAHATNWVSPTTPTVGTTLTAAGAKALVASAVAVAGVAMTLF